MFIFNVRVLVYTAFRIVRLFQIFILLMDFTVFK